MNCLVGSLAVVRVVRPSVDRSGGSERVSVSSVRWMEDVASSVVRRPPGARPPARPIKRAIAAASVFLLPNQHHDDATRSPKFGAVFLGDSFERANASHCGRMALLFRLKKYLLRCAWRAKRIDSTGRTDEEDGTAEPDITSSMERTACQDRLPDKSFWKKVGNEGARDENGQTCIP